MLSPSLAVCSVVQLHSEKCAHPPSKSLVLVACVLGDSAVLCVPESASTLTVSIKDAFNGKGVNRKDVNLEFCNLKVKGALTPAAFTGKKIKKVTKINYPCDSCSLGSRLSGQLPKMKTNEHSLNLMKVQIASYTHISRTCDSLGLPKLIHEIQVQVFKNCYLVYIFAIIYTDTK